MARHRNDHWLLIRLAAQNVARRRLRAIFLGVAVMIGPQALADSRSLRRAALLHKVPYYTTLSGAVAAAQGIRAYLGGDLEVRTLQSYFSEN